MFFLSKIYKKKTYPWYLRVRQNYFLKMMTHGHLRCFVFTDSTGFFSRCNCFACRKKQFKQFHAWTVQTFVLNKQFKLTNFLKDMMVCSIWKSLLIVQHLVKNLVGYNLKNSLTRQRVRHGKNTRQWISTLSWPVTVISQLDSPFTQLKKHPRPVNQGAS